ncbi:MAG: hypothetical protein EHM72_12965 [Calditrichaeota bacterium]|nr:MAG: hypothetical protein EHM72_12965 [Calditrichota bacterium]
MVRKAYTRRGFIKQTGLLSVSPLLFNCSKSNFEDQLNTGRVPSMPAAAHTGGSGQYHEAPMLAEQVAKGLLPPVEQRLPINPFVRVVETIGKYGGTLYDQTESKGGRFFLDGALVAGPQETDNGGKIIRPHLCDRIDVHEDFTEFIFHIREGLRWSDGVELTADDVIWWWEHEQNHRDLYPEGPRTTWKVGEHYARFDKIDQWTFKISFPVPFRPCLNISAHEWMAFGSYFAQPAHYMKQFHIDFNPHADELARHFGYEKWHQLYKIYEEYMRPHCGKPHVGPWIRTASESSFDIYTRNPYYPEVDQEGNQLPYIDQVFVPVIEDRKLRDARAATGAVSQASTEITQIYIYKKNTQMAHYHLKNWQLANSSECMFAFNLNHKDLTKREIYNDVRFRQAMSLSINRKRINDVIYFGRAVECQATLNPDASFFNREWLRHCAEYDPVKANRLLDDMGLAWDANHQYRLQPDGKKLTTVVIFNQQTFPVELLEFVRQDWQDVGMETILKETDFRFRMERCQSGEHDCTCWNADMVEEIAAYLPWVSKWNPQQMLFYALDWWYWYYTGGKSGEEPPEEWKQQFNRMAAWYQTRTDADYRRLGHEVWDFFSRKLVCIGTVGYAPNPVIVKNGLQNVPDSIKMGYGTVWAKSYMVQTYFWDEPQKHL